MILHLLPFVLSSVPGLHLPTCPIVMKDFLLLRFVLPLLSRFVLPELQVVFFLLFFVKGFQVPLIEHSRTSML